MPRAAGLRTPTNPSVTGAATPARCCRARSTTLTVTVTPGANPTSTGISVSGDLTAIGGSATTAFADDGVAPDVTAGDNIFSYGATVPAGTTPGAKSLPVTATDAQARSGSTTIALTVAEPPAPPIEISEIQGAAHISPKVGTTVTTTGIVIGKIGSSFYIQDPTPDAELGHVRGPPGLRSDRRRRRQRRRRGQRARPRHRVPHGRGRT